ncbi:transporter [Lacrimispora sp. NSJ-141]|uniref:Transporter n=1 Tax=Lientehia hominis TaxID=2897778 RepID=A0AAP2RGC9_9FIRM|nr:transporter [Lientehia hominis]MCD2491482.1 transporter [Lientehia hominis]
MNIFLTICIGLTEGVLIGYVLAAIKVAVRKNHYSGMQQEKARTLISKLAYVMKYVTSMLLVIGFIWCIFFLVMAIVVPNKADYANNMAELIVAVLTVISIIFAFIEFVKREK